MIDIAVVLAADEWDKARTTALATKEPADLATLDDAEGTLAKAVRDRRMAIVKAEASDPDVLTDHDEEECR